jgi:hypothetical protein
MIFVIVCLFVCFNLDIVKEVDMIFKATGDVYIVQYDETHSAKKWERISRKKMVSNFYHRVFQNHFLSDTRKVQMNFIQRVDRANF